MLGVDKTMKRNTQKRFSCQKYYSALLSEEEEKFTSANAFDLARYFCGWEIANLDIRSRIYALFGDKFHANGKTTRDEGRRKGEKVAEAFDFNSREESCMTWMESGRDQTLEKETLERPAQVWKT